MKQVSRGTVASTPFLVGPFLLLCALTFYYFAVLKIDYHKTALLDLGPRPDAVEYFAQAQAMLKHEWPSIQIGYDKLPSRYPFGYPALMLPSLTMLPSTDSILAPFRTNQALGLFLLFAVFAFYVYLGIPLTGGFAVLLLATLPGFITFCRSSLSEISSSVLLVLAFMFVYIGLAKERRWPIYLAAVFLGLSLNVRLQMLFFAPILLVMALFPSKGLWLRWFFHCTALSVTFVLAASPILIMNTLQFHSPLKTGYDFWAPYWSEQHLLFALRYVPSNVASLWREFTLKHNRFVIAHIFGTGTHFVPAFMLLTLIGLSLIRTTRFVACALLSGLSYLAATLYYRYGVDGRFYLPLLLLLVAIAVLPVTWAAKNFLVRRRAVASGTIFLLFAAACVGFPSRSGYNTPPINRSQAWDAIHFAPPGSGSVQFVAQKYFVDHFGKEPSIVLSDISPVYLNTLFSPGIIAAPLDEKHDYQFSKFWHYGKPQALALVERGLGQSLPVYALFVSTKQMDQQRMRLPTVAGYQWATVCDSAAGPAILKLVAFESGPSSPL